MANNVDYKLKYKELKEKFLNSVDTAFRLGFEQGMKDAQMQNMQQQAQQQADQQAQMGQQNADQEGAPGEEQEGAPQEVAAPDSANPQGSELDQHISELESMIGKSEINPTDLLKALNTVKGLKKSMEFQREMKKSTEAIPAIAKALHKPSFKIGVQAAHNMSSNAKNALSMQEKIVSEVMQKWEAEEKKASEQINKTLSLENLIKKD